MVEESVLICDIGGTNVRFGIYSADQKENVEFDKKYKCTEFNSFEEAVGCYLKEKKVHPTLCVIGAAGDMDEAAGVILGTNTPWKASVPALKATYPFFKHVRMVNDFALQGWALSELKQDQYCPVFSKHNISLKKGKIVVVGPGTGLGTCLIMQDARKPQVIYTSEAGHSTVPYIEFKTSKENALRDRLIKAIKSYCDRKGTTPVIEHIVSGTGITNIYHAVRDGFIPLEREKRVSSEKIEEQAAQGDQQSLLTFKIFNSYLGAHVGTMAATTKTKHIFFCGGLMASPWVLKELQTTPDFMEQFTKRAALTNAMKEVHFSASLYRDMAKLGAVVRAKRLLDLNKTERAKVNANKDLIFKLTTLQVLVEQEGGSKAQRTMKRLIKAVENYKMAQKGKGAYHVNQ